METIREMFLEDPTVLYALLAVAWLVIALFWRRSASPKMTVALGIPFVLAGGVFLVSRWVVTDRERIARSVDEIARAVNEARLDRLRDYLEEDFSVSGRSINSARQAMELLDDRVRSSRFESIRIRKVDLDVQGRLARIRVQSTLYFQGGGRLSVQWDLTWARTQGRWRIRNLDGYTPGASPF